MWSTPLTAHDLPCLTCLLTYLVPGTTLSYNTRTGFTLTVEPNAAYDSGRSGMWYIPGWMFLITLTYKDMPLVNSDMDIKRRLLLRPTCWYVRFVTIGRQYFVQNNLAAY